MFIDNSNSKHITAESGKIFKRISDNTIFGNELYLGITYYLNQELLETPLEELPEHFVEVDEVIIEDKFIENIDIETIITGGRLDKDSSYIEDVVIVE